MSKDVFSVKMFDMKHVKGKVEKLKKILIYQRVTKTIADYLASYIRDNIAHTYVDDLLNEGRQHPDMQVAVEPIDNGYKVTTFGEDTLWVEFGAGVYYNGAVGSSPHPKGEEFGYTIGGYGKGQGRKAVWGFYDEGGDFHLTHGTAAQQPVFKGYEELLQNVGTIIKERVAR